MPTRTAASLDAGHPQLMQGAAWREVCAALERAADSGKPALVNVAIRQDREFKGGIYV